MTEEQRHGSTEAVSLEEQVAYSRAHSDGRQHSRQVTDPIDELREHCKRFIEGAGLTQHTRMNALPKLDEMIFWIRAGAGRG